MAVTQRQDTSEDQRTTPTSVQHDSPWRPARVVLAVALPLIVVAWLAPLAYAFYTSLRSFEDTARNGYVSFPERLTLENYATVFQEAEIGTFFINTMIVTIPALVFILLLSSMVAFGLARFSSKFNVIMLMVFTAGNLLPQQVIVTPLFRLYLQLPVPEWLAENGTLLDSYAGLILIHVAFQMGFVTFVLSNYMKTIPDEVIEAAVVDGASLWTQYWRVVLPLTRPPMAALATLEFTWIYNDFFWAVVLMPTAGDKRPITTALQNLDGVFFTNNNLIAAGSLLAAVPTLVVFVALQKQFVRGLTLGSTKG